MVQSLDMVMAAELDSETVVVSLDRKIFVIVHQHSTLSRRHYMVQSQTAEVENIFKLMRAVKFSCKINQIQYKYSAAYKLNQTNQL